MSELTFSNRFKLWWEATRVLAGKSTVPLLIETIHQHKMLPNSNDYVRWQAWKKEGEPGDPRVGMAHGYSKDFSIVEKKYYGPLLAYILFDEGSSDLQAWAASRWHTLYPHAPSHYEMLWRDGILSLHDKFSPQKEVAVEDLNEKPLSGSQLKWLMAWSMVSQDQALQNYLFPKLLASEWQRGWEVDNQSFTWIHWSLFLNDESSLRRSISEGFSLHENLHLQGGFQERCQAKLKIIQSKSLKLDLPPSNILKEIQKEKTLNPLVLTTLPVYRAVELYQESVLPLLLKQGLNTKNQYNECTPLRLALQQEMWKNVKVLADHFAPLFEDNNAFSTIKLLGRLDSSKIKNEQAFNSAIRSIFENVLKPNQSWNPDHPDYVKTLSACVNNVNVSPVLVQGMVDTARGKSLINVSCKIKREDDGKEWSYGAFAASVICRNETMMKGLISNGVRANTSWDSKMSVLPVVAYFTPKALPALLAASSPQSIESSLDLALSQFDVGGWNYPWNNFNLATLMLKMPSVQEVFKAFSENPTTEKWLKKYSEISWHSIAMRTNNLAAVQAICQYIHPPRWEKGAVIKGACEPFKTPFNEGMIEYMFEEKWPMNFLINEEGLTPLRVAINHQKGEWVEKMVALGADVHHKPSEGLSVHEYLETHTDHSFAEKMKAAIAKGSSAWLNTQTPVSSAPLKTMRL